MLRCSIHEIKGAVPSECGLLKLALAGQRTWAAALNVEPLITSEGTLHSERASSRSDTVLLPGASTDGIELLVCCCGQSGKQQNNGTILSGRSALLPPCETAHFKVLLGFDADGNASTNIASLHVSLEPVSPSPALCAHILNEDSSFSMYAWSSASGWHTIKPRTSARLSTDGGGALKLKRKRDDATCALPLQLQCVPAGRHIRVHIPSGPGASVKLCGTSAIRIERVDLRIISIRHGQFEPNELAVWADDATHSESQVPKIDSANFSSVSSEQAGAHEWAWETLDPSRGSWNSKVAMLKGYNGTFEILPFPSHWSNDHFVSIRVDNVPRWDGEIVIEGRNTGEDGNVGRCVLGRITLEAPNKMNGEWECFKNVELGSGVVMDLALRRAAVSDVTQWRPQADSAGIIASDMWQMQHTIGPDSISAVGEATWTQKSYTLAPKRVECNQVAVKNAAKSKSPREKQLEMAIQRYQKSLSRADLIEEQHKRLRDEHLRLSADYLRKQQDASQLSKIRESVSIQREVLQRLEGLCKRVQCKCISNQSTDAAVQIDDQAVHEHQEDKGNFSTRTNGRDKFISHSTYERHNVHNEQRRGTHDSG